MAGWVEEEAVRMALNRNTTPASRLRKKRWKQRQLQKGICLTCGGKLKTSRYCEYHAELHAQQCREYYERSGRKVWRERKAKKNYGIWWEHQMLIIAIYEEIKGKSYGTSN